MLEHPNRYFIAKGRSLEMIKSLLQQHELKQSQTQFAQMVGVRDVSIYPGLEPAFAGESYERSAEFKQLGDNYIIMVPVIHYADGDDWVCPPNAIALPVSEYFRLQEECGNLNLEPSSKNHVEMEGPGIYPGVHKCEW